MNSMQIEKILSKDRVTQKYFLGVFPSDLLPSKIERYPACFVCNADKSTEPGSHWIAFYLTSPKEAEFFDSYGNNPSYFKGPISNYASHFSQVTFNPLRLQSHVTAVCGQFCVFYIFSRCEGKTLKHFLNEFVSENICNDHRVYNFVAKRYRIYANFYQ